MDLITFFQKFDQFADAPDAVAKLRELVLHLAFSGKLLSTMEPWPSKPLKSLATKIGSGATPAGGKESYFNKGIPLIRSMNVHFAGFEPKGLVFLSDEQAKQLANVAVQSGDVLLNITGASIGRVTTAPSELAGARVNQHVAIIRPTQELDARFLAKFLASPAIQRMIDDVQVGATREALTKGMIEQFEIPLPPLAEQKRIVAKVDELMALCDRLEAQQQERETRRAALAHASLSRFAEAPTPANLEWIFHPSYPIPPADLRKAILTLAVQGKLVPQDPNDEPVDELLKRSLAERRKLKRTEMVKVQPLSAEATLGYDIPESWRWQRLDDLLIFGPTNGFSPKAVDYETPVRSLTLSATTSGRFKGEHSKFITAEVPADSDLWLRDGDILVQRGNSIEYVGVAAVYRGGPNSFVYPDLMMKLRVSAAFDVGYIHLAMSHDASRDFLRVRASGTSGSMPKINQTTLKSLPIPIPPLAEQRRIVAKVDQLMSLVDALETQLAASRATAANLLSAIVAELTAPSAPSSPPASASRSTAQVVSREPEFIRSVFAAEVIDRLHAHETFGQVKLQKILHLAEYIFQLPEIDSHPLRYAAGPHDPQLIREVEHGLRVRDWFSAEPRADGPGHVYRPLSGAGSHRDAFTQLWPAQAIRIRAFLDELRSWKTERCERFATLYAAWNDLLIWGQKPTDAAILEQILEKWDPAKKRIPRDLWLDSLRWMREHGYTSTGFGRATREKPQEELSFL
jgi:type I restriction enzyme, S subunit